ncbi:anti-sigma factor [Fulvitalea axinellae]|uniref:Anti-sigma factor n=1 Tax=Fulvitalea axinellae TaxID=1182444 RepID=A0AAU9CBZ0_9BACT|nr:anti-sigma factor [Fulvitalea axinellae]
MKYNSYEIQDFLTDLEFIDWVRKGDDKADFFQEWLHTDPENKREALIARDILLRLDVKKLTPSQEEYRKSLKRLLRNKRVSIDKRDSSDSENVRGKLLPYLWKSVAMIAFLLIAFGWEWQQRTFETEMQKVEWVSRSCPYGSKLKITLPDKSVINLNSGSRVEFPRAFRGNRKVRLVEGEAFFEVKKISDSPFLVYSDGLEVKVVGTSFNVRAFADEEEIKVSVLTGKVITTGKQDNDKSFVAHLTPNEVIRFEKKSGNYAREYVPDLNILWKSNTIVFENVPFSEAVLELERWYGYTFEFPDKNILKIPGKINGKYKGKSLVEVLDGFTFSLRLEYDIDYDKKIVTVRKSD